MEHSVDKFCLFDLYVILDLNKYFEFDFFTKGNFIIGIRLFFCFGVP